MAFAAAQAAEKTGSGHAVKLVHVRCRTGS